MPSKSKKQARKRNGVSPTMRAAAAETPFRAHDPAFARKMGIPSRVAKDFARADKKVRAAQPKLRFGLRRRR